MRTVGDWKLMEDGENIENRNAGNGGDLIKHTVYLCLLRHLLARKPWSEETILRECHAGRGAYQIGVSDPRFRLLSCLYSEPAAESPVLLHDTQRTALRLLECWPPGPGTINWYAGSALINAVALNFTEHSSHKLELYEWLPETRAILRSVLASALPERHRVPIVLPEVDLGCEFDGEAYIAHHIRNWGKQNVVLLDPFAMWRQPADQNKRDLYGAIIDGVARRGPDAPSFALFWTWGRAFPAAEGDLNGTAQRVRNGYADLREKLHNSGLRFVRVQWRWGLQFAMWVLVPADQLAPLRDDIDLSCRLLSKHLLHSCHRSLGAPQVEVKID